VQESHYYGMMAKEGSGMKKRSTRKSENRSLMINAVLDTIAEDGLANANVRQISDKAGVSFGNFHYHFGGKDGLLLEALKQLLKQIQVLTKEGVAKSNTPAEQLNLYVEAQFNPSIFTNRNAVIWLNFWNEASTNESFARFELLNRRRLRSNIRYYLRACGVIKNVEEIAADTHVLIDGLWMHKALMKDGLKLEDALATVRRKLKLLT